MNPPTEEGFDREGEEGTATRVRLRPPQNLVSPRAVPMWTLRAVVGALFAIAFVSAAASIVAVGRFAWAPPWLLDNIWWIPAVYAVYALGKAFIVPQLRYRVHRWEVSEDVVYTRAGWLNVHWQLVPISRIQTVDYTRNWMERLFRVATVEIQTASHAGSSVIVGLDEDTAQGISEDLAARAGELRDDAT